MKRSPAFAALLADLTLIAAGLAHCYLLGVMLKEGLSNHLARRTHE